MADSPCETSVHTTKRDLPLGLILVVLHFARLFAPTTISEASARLVCYFLFALALHLSSYLWSLRFSGCASILTLHSAFTEHEIRVVRSGDRRQVLPGSRSTRIRFSDLSKIFTRSKCRNRWCLVKRYVRSWFSIQAFLVSLENESRFYPHCYRTDCGPTIRRQPRATRWHRKDRTGKRYVAS